MATFTKLILSGAADGRMVKVVATSTPGTTIHTAIAGSTSFDEAWIYAQNNHTTGVVLTIELGGTSSPDDLIQVSVNAKSGLLLVVPGVPLNNGVVVKAFAATANVISLAGWVNRIAP